MTKDELLKKLKEIQKEYDTESAHVFADNFLLEYINDREITEEYEKIDKWYA